MNFLAPRFGHKRQANGSQHIDSTALPGCLRNISMEHLCYCVELEKALTELEIQLHASDDPKEIALSAMKTACDFYQADWAGLLDIDMDLGIWTPYWWYNTNMQDKTSDILNEVESAQFLNRWVAAMRENHPIIVPNVEEIRDAYPEEYAIYQRLNMRSIIGVPIKPRPVAFMVVRNPKRYLQCGSMLQLLAYVVLNAANERKMIDSTKCLHAPADIEDEKEVYIKFFGNMGIFTAKGALLEQDMKAPKCTRVLAYLMLNRKSTHPPLEIAEALWPNDISGPDALSSNIRGLIYRFRQSFSAISDYQLIESTPNGYRINPALHITSDVQQFDQLWRAVQNATATSRKVDLLKQAAEIYKGPIYENACDEHWIINTVNHYSLRYTTLINELLSKLASVGDYSGMQHYAAKALELAPENVKIRYWLVYAMYHLGAIEMAHGEVERSKDMLTAEEYEAFLKFLELAKNDANELLPHKEHS